MKNSAIWVLALSLWCLNSAFAMRCGQKLVEPGNRRSDVIARCGQPDSIETHTKIIGSTLNYPYGTPYLQQYEEVQVEEWIYNFGSSRLQQYLRFENGRLKEVRSLGRGY